mmetsp:Transcript_15484/g.34067  ORF Transcript_15484/g.34067 Transcript_15484/m.34067 type:complete len:154 (-) Transcript_15484:86-547(-)
MLKLLLWLCGVCGALQPSEPLKARRAIALLASASAREAQLDATDQVFWQRLQRCEPGKDCEKLKDEYNRSRTALQILEAQTLKRATSALEDARPQGLQSPRPFLSVWSEANLRKSLLAMSLVGLAVVVLWARWGPSRWSSKTERSLLQSAFAL